MEDSMGDVSLDNVNEMYLDVLKEIGNIGAGNATTAIAQERSAEKTSVRARRH